MSLVRSKSLLLAGTFDHLHKGHQQFIQKAAAQADFVFCGLSQRWHTRNKTFPQTIQSFPQRLNFLKKFLKQNGLQLKTHIFPLKNPIEPAGSDPHLETLAVTPDTLRGAQKVNQQRKKNQLLPLKILKIKLVKASDQNTISSTRIRAGEIDRQGLVYQQRLNRPHPLYLPSQQRHYFKKPLGKLISGSKKNLSWAGLQAFDQLSHTHYPLIITIGDISTQAFLLNHLPLDLAVFDNRCQRQAVSPQLHLRLKKQADFCFHTVNPPGTLSPQTIQTINQTLTHLKNKSQGIIEVAGEEDLLVLPLVLLSPLKTLIFYGQPNKGLVRIQVSEKIKVKTLKLLQKFQVII